jgi:2-amino-4-hydroxy-6-hydroxymethyldihydropteridine diphosphokinase
MQAPADAPQVWTPAWIGLGANLGERAQTIEQAIDALRRLPRTRLTGRSRQYLSAPHQAQGPDFVNAVARIETLLAPGELLEALHRIEANFGRERPYRNAPRPLDLDLLVYGDRTISLPGLQVPHPRLHERAFVLRPLAELDPDLLLPGLGPVRQWLPRVAAQRCDPTGPIPRR